MVGGLGFGEIRQEDVKPFHGQIPRVGVRIPHQKDILDAHAHPMGLEPGAQVFRRHVPRTATPATRHGTAPKQVVIGAGFGDSQHVMLRLMEQFEAAEALGAGKDGLGGHNHIVIGAAAFFAARGIPRGCPVKIVKGLRRKIIQGRVRHQFGGGFRLFQAIGKNNPPVPDNLQNSRRGIAPDGTEAHGDHFPFAHLPGHPCRDGFGRIKGVGGVYRDAETVNHAHRAAPVLQRGGAVPFHGGRTGQHPFSLRQRQCFGFRIRQFN